MCYRWFIVVALAVLLAGSVLGENSAGAEDSYDSEELEFLKIINQYRQNNGVAALILSDALTLASERHSKDMGRYGFYDHNTAKSSYFPAGSKPWDRMARSGYDYNATMAENLAASHDTARRAFEAWHTSPGHNANMLDGNQKVIGIARVHVPGSKYRWYWTTDFGSKVDPTAHAPGETPPSERQASQKKQASERAGKARDRNTDRGSVENGSMNEDTVWEQRTTKEGNSLIREGVARLGGYDNAEDEISQKIRIQKGQKLTYRVRVATEEREHPVDSLVVRLTDGNGKHLLTFDSHTDSDTSKAGEAGWIRGSVNLWRFAGKTVKLSFLAKTDGERPTAFYVDDVALR